MRSIFLQTLQIQDPVVKISSARVLHAHQRSSIWLPTAPRQIVQSVKTEQLTYVKLPPNSMSGKMGMTPDDSPSKNLPRFFCQ